MNAKQQKTNAYAHLEKTLTLAGLALIILGCIANLYGAYSNVRFINDPIDSIYYFRYVLLLAGGLAIGCFIANRPTKSTLYNRLFIGVTYAALAIALYWLLDVVRVGLQSIFEPALYPWGKILFMGVPSLSIIAVLVIAYLSRYKPNRSDVSAFAKTALILSFIVYQAYILVSSMLSLMAGSATYSPDIPAWLIIGNYLITPLVMAIVAYFILHTVKKRSDRFFYAALIGTFYSTLAAILWEFRTDPSYDATNIFNNTVVVITVLFVGVLLWRAHRAIRKY